MVALATTFISASAFAGGFVTNTNQTVAFLRQPAQDATISASSAYFNPAGVGFLDRKFHFSFNWQSAHQSREVTANYAPLALGNASAQKKYKGFANANFLPSVDLAWRFTDDFFASFHFGVVGGGGKATYDNGLGSLESMVAIYPAVINGLVDANVCTYSADINLIGKQYIFAGQLNIGYRINEHLSIAAGLRANYLYNNYSAGIRNISIDGLQNVPALAPLAAGLGALLADRELDCTQTDLAWTPVIGIDYKAGPFNFAAKYEFNTSVRLKNETAVGKDAGMAHFADGADDIASDIPALLTIGASYDVLPSLHLNLGFHQYFDKNASFHNSATGANDRQDSIDKNAYELLAGVEYDLSKKFTVSAGGQLTRFGWGEGCEFINDQSFNVNSYSLGAGFRYHLNDKICIDAAVFKTFYDKTDKVMADYNNAGASAFATLSHVAGQMLGAVAPGATADSFKVPGTDTYYRTNTVFGLGINIAF